MLFRQLFDRESSTYTYLLADEDTREAVLIDPVREQIERDVQLLDELDLTLVYSLETHVHADHVTSSGVLRKRLGCETVLSAAAGAGCPDVLVEDGEVLEVGAMRIEARHTPGHTDGDVTYVVAGPDGRVRAFTGDTLLIRGCGRTDFQQGDADALYDSVTQKIFTLPDETPVYPGHDYEGRTSSTVGEEKRHNPRLGGGKTREEFVRIMAGLNLAQPKKIDEAVPANLRCGIELPPHVMAAAQPAVARDDAPGAPVARTDAGVPEIEAPWLRDHATEVRMIDVRESDELAGPLGALEGIEHVPLGSLRATIARWKDADPEQRIVVVCRSGGRSGEAAVLLERAGFTRVASLRGGMLGYRAMEQQLDVAQIEGGTCGG